MSVFLTIMAVIGIVVTVVVLTVAFMVVRVILKVRRGLAEASVRIVTPHRGTGAETGFASAGSVTLAPDAWTSSDTPRSDVGDSGSGGSDGAGGDGGNSSSSGSH
jgi:uncharacterized membrane protein YgcG